MGIDRKSARVPSKIIEGECMYFDFKNFNYGTMPCNNKALTICYIKKSSQIMQDRLFWETINDKISELTNVNLSKKAKIMLQNKFESIPEGECSEIDGRTFSFTEAISIKEPTEMFSKRLHIDKDIYSSEYLNFVRDVDNFKKLLYAENFELAIKMMLGISADIKLFKDSNSMMLCFDTKIKILPTQTPSTPPESVTNASVSNKTERNLADEFANYSIIELILALCAAITTMIAVINSICIAIVSKTQKERDQLKGSIIDKLNNGELTPILSRKVKFGSDQVSQYDPYSSSIDHNLKIKL